MQPLRINTVWNEEANVWVATSEDVNDLAIEASTIDALVERLKSVIPELMALNNKELAEDELPFMLEGFMATRRRVQKQSKLRQLVKGVKLYQVAGFFIAASAIFCFAVPEFFMGDKTNDLKKWAMVFWLIGPPLYFFIELHLVRKFHKDELANCKESQESAAKIWAGVAAALAIFWFEQTPELHEAKVDKGTTVLEIATALPLSDIYFQAPNNVKIPYKTPECVLKSVSFR